MQDYPPLCDVRGSMTAQFVCQELALGTEHGLTQSCRSTPFYYVRHGKKWSAGETITRQPWAELAGDGHRTVRRLRRTVRLLRCCCCTESRKDRVTLYGDVACADSERHCRGRTSGSASITHVIAVYGLWGNVSTTGARCAVARAFSLCRPLPLPPIASFLLIISQLTVL